MTEVRRPPVGSGQGFQHAVAEVRTAHGARGTVAGAGFLVGPGLLVTCAHVVANAGYGPGQRVPLSFPSWSGAGAGEVHGTVETDTWREADAEDTAFLRLDAVPAGAVPLPLGIAEDCAQHPGVTYGFPRNARQGGHFGTVRIGRLLEGAGDEAGTVPLLQLSEANAVTEGFSGGPVLDEVTGLVIGMTTAITGADRHGRGAEVAYATPARTLRALHPELAEHAVCPYPGLKPFTTEDAAVFRGRATALEAVLAALRGPLRVILLLGPSGSGKSSLLRAGVLPTLAEGLRVPGGDRWLPVVVPGPGRDLLLAAEEHGLPGAATDGIGPAAERLLAERPDRTRVLLVVDQFEELLAPTATPEDRSGIGAAAEELAALARSWAPVTVVLAMRDDFYAPLAARAPALLEATAPHVNVPATLDASDLRAMIEHGEHGPLVESGLTARLIGDLIPPADGPQPRTTRSTPVTCLPALQLTLRQLWEGRSHGTLTHETYDRLGTVTGALSAWCTTEFRLLPHPDTARTILTALVEPADPDHAIPAARRRVPVPTLRALTGGPEAGSRPAIGSGFGIRPASGSHIGTGSDSGTGQAEFDATLAALVDRRFVTLRTPRSEPSAGGQPGAVRPAEPVAELVHDSLVRDWPQLHQWVTTDQEFQRWLRRAEDRHARWLRAPEGGPWLGLRLRLPQRLRPGGAGPAPARAPHRTEELLHGGDLAAGLSYSRTRGLPPHLRRYLVASRRRARRRTSVLAGLLALALVTGGVAGFQRYEAAAARQEAEARRHDAESRAMVVASDRITATHPEAAMLLAAHAYRAAHTPEAAAAVRAYGASPLPRALTGHTGWVEAVLFSPDGTKLATPADDGTARLWDARTGRALHVLGHAGGSWVNAASFSPDGTALATAGKAGSARLWDTTTGRLLRTLPHTGNVRVAVFTPDGRNLVTAGGDGTARLWDTATGSPLRTFTHGADVRSAVLGPDGAVLATAGADGTVRLWDTTTGRLLHTLTGHSGAVQAVAFRPDGTELATASEDGTVRLWDPVTGRALHTLRHGEEAETVMFGPDGTKLTTGGGDTDARLWDTGTGRLLHTLAGAREATAFSPDGRTLATSGSDSSTRLWDTATGRPLRSLPHLDGVTAVGWSPDGANLATATMEGAVRLWDAGPRRRVRVLSGLSVNPQEAAFSPDGRTLADVSGARTVRVRDTTDGRTLHTLPHQEQVAAVAFSPDGATLAVATDDGGVSLWNSRTGAPLRTLTGRAEEPYLLRFSPDGGIVATAAGAGKSEGEGKSKGTVSLWETATGRVLTVVDVGRAVSTVAISPDGRALAIGALDPVFAVADTATGRLRFSGTVPLYVNDLLFSPDGRTLAVAGEDATLWDSSTGRPRRELTGHSSSVLSLAFAPDGRSLATAGRDGTARLWDTATGRPRRVLTGHTANVASAAFSPDGRTLATASHDGTARLWDTATGRGLATLIGHTAALTSVDFGTDGLTLATIGTDGTARQWNVDLPDPAEATAAICAFTGRDLTAEEAAAYLPPGAESRVC